MESCKQVLEALAEYLEGDLTAEDRMRFERHMQVCPPCDAFLKTYCKSGALGCKLRLVTARPQSKSNLVMVLIRRAN